MEIKSQITADISKLIATATNLIQAGRLVDAESICQDILKAYPNQADAIYLLATIAFRQNKPKVAINLVNKAITIHPISANYYLLLGDIYTKLGRLNDAINSCLKSIKLNPEYAEAYNNLGILYREQGKYDASKKAFDKAISINPQRGEFLNNRAVIALDENVLDKAEDLLKKAIDMNPDYIDAHSNLGKVLINKGQLDEAIKCFEKVLIINPYNFESNYYLGTIYLEINNFDNAILFYKKCLSINPNHFQTLFNLTISYYNIGAYDKAFSKIETAYQIDKHNSAVYFWLGLIALKLKNYQEAINNFESTIKLNNKSAQAYYNLGFALYKNSQYKKAIESYRNAIKLNPDFSQAFIDLGCSLMATKNYTEAEFQFIQAMKLSPDNPNVYINLGNIQRFNGNINSAIDYYKKALLVDHENIEAHRLLAFIKKDKNEALEHAVQITNILNNKKYSNSDRIKLNFSLGNIYDQCEMYDEAFSHFSYANELVYKDIIFDCDKKDLHANNICRFFDDDFFKKRTSFGIPTDIPIFIIGMPRSGTTLVEQIISSHHRVKAAGEITDIDNIKSMLGGNYPQIVDTLDESRIKELGNIYLDKILNLCPDATYITNKLPTNFINLGWIYLLFPNAKIIHCMRNPLDTCLSIYFQYFTQRNDYAYDLYTIGRYYNLYRKMMLHWYNSSYINIFNVSYENLVADQEHLTHELINYIGLDWDEKCLHFYNNDNYVTTSSVDQVRKPIYKNSVNRWEKYKKHLEPLINTIKPEYLYK